jgi:tRNA(fMet)-specific endonuclease VapC
MNVLDSGGQGAASGSRSGGIAESESARSAKEEFSPRYMLDTGTCVEILLRYKAVTRRLESVRVQDVCISAVTLAELQFGVAMSRLDEQDGAALGIFLRHIQVLEFPAKAAAHYGQVRAALHWRGVRIGPNELLIAAHARCAKMTLVTRRTRELKNVPEMLAESWMK